MSASLLKRALNLFDDLQNVKDAQKSKKKKSVPTNSATNKWGISKLKQQHQFKQKRPKKKALPSEEKRTRAIIEELRREQAADRTEENLRTFQKLSQMRPKFSMEQLHTRMRDGESSEKSSVFTDQDFRRFEEEYCIA